MPDPFRRLRERASLLGNHHAKYLRHIEEWKDRLVELLENTGRSDEVHLWVPATHSLPEMMVIRNLADTPGENENLLGCYYALQFLQMNLRLTDALRFELTVGGNTARVQKDFMIRSGLHFRLLTANYMHVLLDLLLPEEQRPEFVVCGVGSRSDQDDIDVAIIDDGSPAREDLNRAIGKLSKEMLRRASFLHFYLSEHFRAQRYSATVAEYRQLLDQEGQDFILINEVIGAALILGSEPLLEQFNNEVTWRYHFASDRDNRYHEAYLRGILGEVRSLLAREERLDVIRLKDDALRVLKAMIYVEKTRFRIDKVNPWDILAVLQIQNPSRRELYGSVEETLDFLEIFRHLYQLFVVQEEEVDISQVGAAGHTVAEYLGHRNEGAGWDRLVAQYREHVSKAKACVEILLQDATRHLHRTSTLVSVLKKEPAEQEPRRPNLILEFAREARFFRGARFWDDILEDLEAEEGVLLRRITAEFNALPPRLQARVARYFAHAARNSFYAMISLLVILASNARRCNCLGFFKVLNEAFLNVGREVDSSAAKLARLFHRYPLLVHEYLTALGEEGSVRFEQLATESGARGEESKSGAMLGFVCRLHSGMSRYFHRHFTRAARSHPECLLSLSDDGKLGQVAKGLLAIADGSPSRLARTRILGEYSDLQFLRVALKTVAGCPVTLTNAEFSEFSDVYLARIFDACRQSMEEENHERVPTRGLLAVFTAGARAREQAYDDDCDLIILLDSQDEGLQRYCSQIARRMNSELLKRGAPPHYRFAEYFGRYVTTMDEIRRLLGEPHANDFIDKSQLLGSRMIIGSGAFLKKFEDTILKPFVFERNAEYAAKMIGELEARRRHISQQGEEEGFDLKEGKGGLRDIEMILMVYAARHKLACPANARLIELLAAAEQAHASDFRKLGEALEFLKSVRDVYRLVVSAEDMIQPRYLEGPAQILGFRDAAELCAARNQKSTQVSEILDRLAARALA